MCRNSITDERYTFAAPLVTEQYYFSIFYKKMITNDKSIEYFINGEILSS